MKRVLWIAAVAGLALGVWAASERVTAQEESSRVVAEPEKAEPAAVSPEFQKDIQKFLEVTRAEAQGRQMMKAMFGQFKQAMPQIPAEYWDTFLAKIDFKEFTAMLVPIYAKHMSQEDIKGLTAFFQSPLGQRMIDAQPAISTDSMKAGMAWGQKIAAQVIEDLRTQQEQAPEKAEP